MRTETAPIVEVVGLRKQFGNLTALDVPSLRVAAGESLGLVGNNGAGKTTWFSLLLDLIQPTEGCVLSKGRSVEGSEHWKTYTGAYLDEGFLIGFLSPEEYLEFVAGLHRMEGDVYRGALLRFEEFFRGEILGQEKLIRDLSKGNQKKVGIAAALLTEPEVVILDEPFPNLDPTSVNRLKELIQSTRAERGSTFLISSHNLNHVTDLCERIVVLEKGCVVGDLKTGTETLRELETYFL
jgi:ABC-2 type transport system ATP-binding protein